MRRRRMIEVVMVICLAGAGAACSSDDQQSPVPGGINGPARVDPNSGADNSGTGTDG